MTDDRTATMTLQELWDWKDKLRSKRRGPTKSEELDWEECNRQINEVASETTMDWEEAERDERYMDTCPSPTQRSHPAWTPRYQDARNARKRPLSPPSTPPPLRGSKQQHAGLELYMGNSRIDKRIKRKATRCPTTRTYGVPAITLHHRKGYIYFWHTSWEYVVISYEQYLRDYDREELDAWPSEPMDFSHEDPKRPCKTPYQREVCRRARAQGEQLKNAVILHTINWKGHK